MAPLWLDLTVPGSPLGTREQSYTLSGPHARVSCWEQALHEHRHVESRAVGRPTLLPRDQSPAMGLLCILPGAPHHQTERGRGGGGGAGGAGGGEGRGLPRKCSPRPSHSGDWAPRAQALLQIPSCHPFGTREAAALKGVWLLSGSGFRLGLAPRGIQSSQRRGMAQVSARPGTHSGKALACSGGGGQGLDVGPRWACRGWSRVPDIWGGEGWADAWFTSPPGTWARARPPCERGVLSWWRSPGPSGTCLNTVVATPPPTQPLSRPELEGPRVFCSSELLWEGE